MINPRRRPPAELEGHPALMDGAEGGRGHQRPQGWTWCGGSSVPLGTAPGESPRDARDSCGREVTSGAHSSLKVLPRHSAHSHLPPCHHPQGQGWDRLSPWWAGCVQCEIRGPGSKQQSPGAVRPFTRGNWVARLGMGGSGTWDTIS